MDARLETILARAEALQARLNEGPPPAELAKLSKEYSELAPIAGQIEILRRAETELAEAEAMLADPDMREMAEAEAAALLGVALKTVGRRWRRALLKLHDALADDWLTN
mgnify:CR=1 FL=1